MLGEEKLTVFRHTGSRAYQKIPACGSWQGGNAVRQQDRGLAGDNSVTVFLRGVTVSPGDIILRGDTVLEVPPALPSALFAENKAITVRRAVVYRQGSEKIQHTEAWGS